MHNTSRNRHTVSTTKPTVFPKAHKEHTWGPYSILATLATLTGLAWFAVMIASLSYNNDYVQVVNGADQNNLLDRNLYAGNVLQQFYSYFNFYAFRTICLFASLMVAYNADRHYLSRGAAWTSWVVTTCLFFNWLSTDLPFVYSAFSRYVFDTTNVTPAQAANGFILNSHRSQFCADGVASHWCYLNYAHGILSVISAGVIFLTWCYACYQLKRARGVSNLLLSWPEVAVITFTAIGLIGYIVWNVAAITLSITREFANFTYSDPQQMLNTYRMFVPSQLWANYLIHAAWVASLASVAYISFGGTTAPRMIALICNWLSFMIMFPAFLYMARHNNEDAMGFCSGDRYGFRCPSFDAVAAGLGICMASNFLIGLTMMAVLKQVETSDFAVDMYGDKALAIDAVKSTGSVPIADPHYAATRQSTPEQVHRTLPYTTNNMHDVEMGRPIVA